MAREGENKFKKSKRATIKGSDPQSKRSAKRAKRGFKSLEQSSRKHKRANSRQEASRTIGEKLYKPGEKVSDGTSDAYTAGGALKYY